MDPHAEDFQLDTAIHGMTDAHLQCRDFSHSWRPLTAAWVPDKRVFETKLRCARCKTRRVRHIGSAGQLVSSHYEYPEGYVIKGMGRLDGAARDQLRLESVLRVLPPEQAAQATGARAPRKQPAKKTTRGGRGARKATAS
jgi:hypothetical protein